MNNTVNEKEIETCLLVIVFLIALISVSLALGYAFGAGAGWALIGFVFTVLFLKALIVMKK